MRTPAQLAMTLPPRLARWSSQLVAAELCYGVDAGLLAAIMDRESEGGDSRLLSVKGPAGKGDSGHGRGLMQIDDRSHRSFVACVNSVERPLWEKPAFNVLYAADYFVWLIGYLGATDAALAGWNAGPGKAKRELSHLARGHSLEQRRAALDSITAHGDYVTKVLNAAKLYGWKEN